MTKQSDLESQQFPHGMNRAASNPRVQPDVVQANRRQQATLQTPQSVLWGREQTRAAQQAALNPPVTVYTAPLRIRMVPHSIVSLVTNTPTLVIPANPLRRNFRVINNNTDAILRMRYAIAGQNSVSNLDIPIAPFITTLISGDLIFNPNHQWFEEGSSVSTDDIYILCNLPFQHVIAYEGIDEFPIGG